MPTTAELIALNRAEADIRTAHLADYATTYPDFIVGERITHNPTGFEYEIEFIDVDMYQAIPIARWVDPDTDLATDLRVRLGDMMLANSILS